MTSDATKHLEDIAAAFDSAFFVTRRPDGSLHARPMMLAEREHNGDLWFATNMDSPKIAELEADPHATVTMQDHNTYLCIEGRCELVRDRTKLDQIWSPAWTAWFPKGKDDPTLVLIRLRAQTGEYWDRSGLKGLRYLYESAKAIFRGRRMDTGDRDQHARVQL